MRRPRPPARSVGEARRPQGTRTSVDRAHQAGRRSPRAGRAGDQPRGWLVVALPMQVTVEEAQKPGSLLGDRDGGVDVSEADAGSRRGGGEVSEAGAGAGRGVGAELGREPDEVGEGLMARPGRFVERVRALGVAPERGDAGYHWRVADRDPERAGQPAADDGPEEASVEVDAG